MIRAFRSLTPSRVIVGLGLLLLGIALGAVVSVAAQTNDVLLACAGNNGSLRLVASHDDCRNNETPVEWNVQGPIGPQGPAGENLLFGQNCPDGTYVTGVTDDGTIVCNYFGVCGNGVTEADEECDDGNSYNYDSCTSSCEIQICGFGQTACDGVCVDLLFDDTNCGACGITCGAAETCYAGVCTPADVCGNGIPEAGEQCDDGNTVDGDGCSGTCLSEDACAPGEEACGPVCVDLLSDPNNCGACDYLCGAGNICVYGQCELSCPAGQTACGGFYCASLDTDEANCGACGIACNAGEVCNLGQCETASP